MWFVRQQYSMCWCQSKAVLHVIAWVPPPPPRLFLTPKVTECESHDGSDRPRGFWTHNSHRWIQDQMLLLKGLLTVCAWVTGWLLTALVLKSMLTLPVHTSSPPRTHQPCLQLLSSASGLWWEIDFHVLLHMPSPLFLHKWNGLISENSSACMFWLHFRTVLNQILDLQSDRWSWWTLIS